MNLDTVTDKHLHELERLAKELLETLRRAGLVQTAARLETVADRL